MTITNNTLDTIKIVSGNAMHLNAVGELNYLQTGEYPEYAFNKVEITSPIGSCIITTEYSKRSIKNSGLLLATEGNEKNADGMKNIIISASVE